MGTVLASTIMARAAGVLLDAGYARWTEAFLFDYANAGQQEAALLKPDISVSNENAVLVAGTKQSIPAAGTQLIKLVRNMGISPGTTPGRVIELADMDEFSRKFPFWHQATAAATVRFYFFDPRDPKNYYVYPPQPSSGFGYVNQIYALSPTDMVAGAGPVYTVAITIDNIYQNVLMDYMLYRAYSKDAAMTPNAAARAQAHYAQFATALGRKDLLEKADDPNLKKQKE